MVRVNIFSCPHAGWKARSAQKHCVLTSIGESPQGQGCRPSCGPRSKASPQKGSSSWKSTHVCPERVQGADLLCQNHLRLFGHGPSKFDAGGFLLGRKPVFDKGTYFLRCAKGAHGSVLFDGTPFVGTVFKRKF